MREVVEWKQDGRSPSGAVAFFSTDEVEGGVGVAFGNAPGPEAGAIMALDPLCVDDAGLFKFTVSTDGDHEISRHLPAVDALHIAARFGEPIHTPQGPYRVARATKTSGAADLHDECARLAALVEKIKTAASPDEFYAKSIDSIRDLISAFEDHRRNDGERRDL